MGDIKKGVVVEDSSVWVTCESCNVMWEEFFTDVTYSECPECGEMILVVG